MSTSSIATFKAGSKTPATAAKAGYQANVENAKGYFDLVVNVNANGKAIRISDKFGESRVHVTLGSVDSLIAALQHVKAKNVKTSVEALKFATA